MTEFSSKVLKSVGVAVLMLHLACAPLREEVKVAAAGDLSALLEAAGQRFEHHYPSLTIRVERWPDSIDDSKGLHLVASPDIAVLESYLRQHERDRYTVFLGNELVLAARAGMMSGLFNQSETWDWVEEIDNFSWGSPDPKIDVAGRHTRLAWKLAEIHYNRPGLYRHLVSHQPARDALLTTGDLVRMLAAGELDFAFLYRSAAIRANLDSVFLPPQVSLAEEAYRDIYGLVFLKRGEADGEDQIGAPIRYGIGTIDSSQQGAHQFLEFLLSNESQELFRAMGYRPVEIREVVLGKR